MDINLLKERFEKIITKIKKIDKDYVIIGVIVIAVFIFMIINLGKIKEFENKDNDKIINVESSINTDNDKNEENKEQKDDNSKEQIVNGGGIFVHIDGYINNPGVYEIKENDRIKTLIDKAGGFKEGYSIKNINLAAKLSDGDKIYIPSVSEEKNSENNNNININSSGKGQNVKADRNNVSIMKNNSKININTANISELKQITGIGESTANKIIDYRENVGKFKKIEDIKEVKGIGDAKYESLKNKITI
jgi:competence protein comEA helix-hairpin-helix repeat region